MSERFAPELVALVAAARERASRSGHGSVGPEHFVLALATTGAGYLARRRLCAVALAEAVETRLAEMHANVGYRGTVLREDALDAMVARARTRRGLWRTLSTLEPLDVFDAIAEGGAFSTEIEGARFTVGAALGFGARASAEAAQLGHRNVLAEHALLGACGTSELRAPLEAAGIDVDALQAALDRVLRTRLFASAKLATTEDLVTRACLHANLTHSREVTTARLLVDVLRSAYIIRSLETQGFVAWTLLFAFVHGRLPETGESAKAPRVRVFNDDFSTMEHVQQVLVEDFDLTKEDARTAMLAVHERGSTTLGTFDDGRARVVRANERSRAAGMPLRLELLPAD